MDQGGYRCNCIGLLTYQNLRSQGTSVLSVIRPPCPGMQWGALFVRSSARPWLASGCEPETRDVRTPCPARVRARSLSRRVRVEVLPEIGRAHV